MIDRLMVISLTKTIHHFCLVLCLANKREKKRRKNMVVKLNNEYVFEVSYWSIQRSFCGLCSMSIKVNQSYKNIGKKYEFHMKIIWNKTTNKYRNNKFACLFLLFFVCCSTNSLYYFLRKSAGLPIRTPVLQNIVEQKKLIT